MTMRVTYGSRAGGVESHNYASTGTGRQFARPPCSSLQQLIDAIRADIDASAQSTVPECTTSEISLTIDAVLPLHQPGIGPYSEGGAHDLPQRFKDNYTSPEDDPMGRVYPQATVDAMTNLYDREERSVVQRAASRGIVAAIEVADGFKYSMNNAWGAKDEDGQRFSYICQDSMQNKDRHANGFPRTAKTLKSEERGPRKPTYDCKGSVSIKCSMARRSVDVFYRHYAIHSSVADRKHLPRPPRAPRTSRMSGEDAESDDEGGLLGRLQGEKTAFITPGTAGHDYRGSSNIGKPLKRKRDEDTPSKKGKPLSLVELLRQSQASNGEKTAAQQSTPPASKASNLHPPPVTYDLPAWLPPAPPPAAVPIPRTNKTQTTSTPQHGGAPYPPPYQVRVYHELLVMFH